MVLKIQRLLEKDKSPKAARFEEIEKQGYENRCLCG